MFICLTHGLVTVVDDSLYQQMPMLREKWHIVGKGYAARRIRTENGIRVYVLMHRFIWEHVNGTIPRELELDHKNGDKLDNRLQNLRLLTHAENACNRWYHREKGTMQIAGDACRQAVYELTQTLPKVSSRIVAKRLNINKDKANSMLNELRIMGLINR